MQSKKGEVKKALDCQIAQIYANDGAKVMRNIVRYLLERKEFYDRWVGTFTGFHSAPMTVIWGLDDPVALESMADRVKAWRPETDLYKLEGYRTLAIHRGGRSYRRGDPPSTPQRVRRRY